MAWQPVVMPDFLGQMARADQRNQSQLQALMGLRQFDQQEQYQSALSQLAPALFGSDPAAQEAATQQLIARGGAMAVPLATNIQGTREQRRIRDEEAAKWEAEQALRRRQIDASIAAQNRETFGAPVPMRNQQTGQIELVQIGNRGTVRPFVGYDPAVEPDKPQVVPPGAALVGRDGRPVFQNDPKEEEKWRPMTPEERVQYGVPENVPAQISNRNQVRQIGSAGVTVNNVGEGAFDREMGQSLAKRIDALDQAGTRAVRQLNTLNRVEKALGEFETGAAAGARLTVGRVAQMLGIPDSSLPQGMNKDAIASGEFIQAQMGRALTEMIGSGGFPAQAFSNADREMLERSIFNIQATPEGNKLIVDTMRRAAQLDRDIAGAWRTWQRENGSSRESAERFFRDRVPQIVTEDPYAALVAAGQSAQPGGIPGPGGVGTATPPPAPAGWSIRPVR